jgi:hypothetical protein
MNLFAQANAYTSFSTNKLVDSFLFYQDILGLNVELINEKLLHLYLPTGDVVVVYYKEDHKPAEFTILNFEVKKLTRVVRKLSRMGINFDVPDNSKYPHKPVDTITETEGSKVAWLRDPGGNIIALVET